MEFKAAGGLSGLDGPDGGEESESERHIRMKASTTECRPMSVGADEERGRVDAEDVEVNGSVNIGWELLRSIGPSRSSSGSVSAISSATLSDARRLKLQATLTARWMTVENGEKTLIDRVWVRY